MFKKTLFTAVLGTVLVSASPQISPSSPGVLGLGDPCTCLHLIQGLTQLNHVPRWLHLGHGTFIHEAHLPITNFILIFLFNPYFVNRLPVSEMGSYATWQLMLTCSPAGANANLKCCYLYSDAGLYVYFEVHTHFQNNTNDYLVACPAARKISHLRSKDRVLYIEVLQM